MNTDNDLETLAPCPCGKVPECLPGRHYRQVACRRCGRRGPLAESEWLAVKLWNNERMIATLCEWQPIETAPTDGRTILVYREDAGVFTALHGYGEDETEPCWFSTDGEDLTPDMVTHWMPLPDPPK